MSAEGRNKGRLLVKEVIGRFGMSHLGNFDCPLCGKFFESIDHLFLHCAWTWNLWTSAMD